MGIEALAFYLFAFLTIASGFMVISARNPVHSVLFLILAFFNSAGLFVLLGAEFLAMIMVIVYVVMFGVMYSLWRDVIGDSDAPGNHSVAA